MKHIKTYKVFESTDLNYSDRDFTNKYFTSKGWIRYTDAHQDSYIDIEKYFDITWDHLGWILEDLVNKCDLLYKCRAADSEGLSPGAEDYGKFGTLADHIVIDLIPESFEKVGGHSGINFITYISKFTHFPPKQGDVLISLLRGIEDKLIENFPYLTILDNDYYPEDHGLDKWNIFLTSSQITLKIKRI
jgi:hypothetical protein